MLNYTPYSKMRQEFSDRGHKKAQSVIYPALFNVKQEQIEFIILEEGEAKLQDCEYAVDRLIKVQVAGLTGKITFTIQERFRMPKFSDFQDVTITEWNHNSNLPSELYKIRANLFLYGYYDHKNDRLVEAIVFHVSPLLAKIVQGKIVYDRGMNEKNQSFISVKFDELMRSGVVEFYKRWGKLVA
jgi:hypothetical protein